MIAKPTGLPIRSYSRAMSSKKMSRFGQSSVYKATVVLENANNFTFPFIWQ